MTETTKQGNLVKADAGQPASTITPMEMLQIAVERGADLDHLTKLMDLQERWEASQARKAFVKALADFKADPPKITKNRHVSFRTKSGSLTEYDHATLDQICDVVGKSLAKHGLSHNWSVVQHENAAVEVTCRLTHELGHSEQVTMRGMPDDSGGKNLIQQIGSTTTYLQRYTLLAVTGLAAADQDTDGETPGEPITAEQKQELVDLIRKTDTDTANFCRYLKVPSLDDLTTKRFGDAKEALELKLRKKEQADGSGNA